MPVCVGARAAGGRARSALGQVPCAGKGGGGGASGHTMGRCLAQLLHTRLVLGGPGGGGAFKAGTPLSFSSGPRLARVGGCVCPVLRAPAAGHGCPTTWLLRESVGQVTGSFLQPTTEPQKGARGVWSEVLLDPEGHS